MKAILSHYFPIPISIHEPQLFNFVFLTLREFSKVVVRCLIVIHRRGHRPEARGHIEKASFLARFVEAEHPLHAELVGQHSEVRAPEGILQGHIDAAFFGQGPEDGLNLLQAFAIN